MTTPEKYNMKRFDAGDFKEIPPGPIWQAVANHGAHSEVFTQAVKLFQRAHGRLSVDGKLGPQTLEAMLNEKAPVETADMPATKAAPARCPHDKSPHLALFMGWGRLSNVQMSEIAGAGCKEAILNMNSATSRKWGWSPSRKVVMEQAKIAIDNGMTICLMPWVWCNLKTQKDAAKYMVELTNEIGLEHVKRWELDAEGSWEVSAKSAAKSSGQTVRQVVSEAMKPIDAARPPSVEQSATVLYFQRPAGTWLISDHCESATIQAYSVWLRTGNKAKDTATHQPGFQPGTLQTRAWNNYAPVFERSPNLERFYMGLGMWAQNRNDAPASMKMPPGEAVRRATTRSLQVGSHGLAWWAAHLLDSKRERLYYDLLLKEMEYANGFKS